MSHVYLPSGLTFRPEKSGYYLHTTDTVRMIEAQMRRGDVAYTARADKPGTYCFRGEGRAVYSLRPASAWVPDLDDGQAVADELGRIEEAARAAGLIAAGEDLPPPGQLARGLLMRFTARTPADEPGPLRILAREGIHQGPMLLTRASAPRVELWDRSQAFLEGLRVGVGTRWDVRHPPAAAESYVRRLMEKGAHGLIHAEMEAPEGQHIPLLPCATLWGQVYGTGLIRNTWTFEQVHHALQNGYKMGYVFATAHATRLEPIYAKMADFIEALPYKPLRKGIYRVAWGVLAGGSGMEGRPEKGWSPGASVYAGSRLYWIEKPAPDPWQEEGVSNLFRPSHAAAIAGDNHVRVQRVLADHGSNVVQVLLDSVTLSGLSATGNPPGHAVWKLEGGGAFRGYGTGNYRLLAGEFVTRERNMGKPEDIGVNQWFEGLNAPRDRHWTGNPATDPNAESSPLVCSEETWGGLWDDEGERDRPRPQPRPTALPPGYVPGVKM